MTDPIDRPFDDEVETFRSAMSDARETLRRNRTRADELMRELDNAFAEALGERDAARRKPSSVRG